MITCFVYQTLEEKVKELAQNYEVQQALNTLRYHGITPQIYQMILDYIKMLNAR